MKMRIESDGTANGTRVYDEDGNLVRGVTAITFAHRASGLPEIELHTVAVDTTTIEGEVRWVGLERVPTDALQGELARRGD